jgi:hypothetical protein
MTPQERQLVDDLFDRLAKLESAPRDADATAAIAQGMRNAPNAAYALVQTVLLQDEVLKRANQRIQELEQALGSAQPSGQSQSGGFLDSMRDAVFGKEPRGSVPNVPPPPPAQNRPVWNSGQVMQQMPQQGQYQEPYGQGPYGQGSYGQGPYGQGGFGQPYGGSPIGGGGGSFLGTAAATAAGFVGGSLLLNSIRSMMGGHQHQAFGDTSITNDGGSPWRDESNSQLARDAGIGDIGQASGRGADTSHRAGLFDQASNDDNDRDDMDMDSDDDFGNDGGGNDSDYT